MWPIISSEKSKYSNIQVIMDPNNDQQSMASYDTGYWSSDAESEVDSMEAQWGSDTE